MRGQAILAGVAVCDGHRDLFTQSWAERSPGEGSERPPHACERRRRVRHRPEHGRHRAECGVDLVELLLDDATGRLGFDEGNIGRESLLRLPYDGGLSADTC